MPEHRCIHAYHHCGYGNVRPAGWVCSTPDRQLVDIDPAIDCIDCPRFEEWQPVRNLPPDWVDLERLAGELGIG